MSSPLEQSAVADVNFADPAFLAAPWPELQRLQREAPLYWSLNQRGWIVTRHADVKAAYFDRRLSSARGDQLFRNLPPGFKDRVPQAAKYNELNLNRMDGLDHLRIRTLMLKAFRPSAVRALQPMIERIVGDILDRVEKERRFDYLARVSAELPMAVVQHLLGMDNIDRAVLFKIASDYTAASSAASMTEELMLNFEATTIEMNTIFDGLIAEHRANPRDDITTALIEARDGDDRLSHDELLCCLQAVVVAGAETTAHTLGTQLVQIARRPHLRDRVAGDPEGAFAAVTELLRYPGTVKCMTRMAAEDFEWLGQSIAKGDLFWLMNAGANVDPEIWEDPFAIDPERDTSASLAFAPGMHHCIGHLLTRLELATFFAQAFSRFDVQILTENLEFISSYVFHGYKALDVQFQPRMKSGQP